ncbi:hypothetical protein JHK87_025118 [Glycine soja]|nr:hypothetical protein JHK87_025118 [Glycine soja]
MSYVYLGKAQNLVKVLSMLPSLSNIEPVSCSLNELHADQLVRATNVSRVQVPDLAENGLEAQILDAFHNMTFITKIDLSHNNLNSTPFWLSSCNKLVFVFLASGLKGLQYLGLSGNKISHIEGSLASIMGNCCHLQSLIMSRNKIQGDALGGIYNPDALGMIYNNWI